MSNASDDQRLVHDATPAQSALPGHGITSARLETFTDGVIAILITIMVLELRVPNGHGWQSLTLHGLISTVLAYLLSFVFLGIYWNNHHHMMTLVHHVSGGVLWANLHLLFWLSLIPFATNWMGKQTTLQPLPSALYGVVGLGAAIAYYILLRAIIRIQGHESELAIAVGRDVKGKISPAAYAVAIPAAFLSPWISIGLYVAVALMWLVPDRRIESRVGRS